MVTPKTPSEMRTGPCLSPSIWPTLPGNATPVTAQTATASPAELRAENQNGENPRLFNRGAIYDPR